MRESVPPLSSRSIQRASSSFFRGEMVMPQNEAMDPLGDLTRGFREMGLSAFGALMGASTLRAPARGSPSSGLDERVDRLLAVHVQLVLLRESQPFDGGGHGRGVRFGVLGLRLGFAGVPLRIRLECGLRRRAGAHARWAALRAQSTIDAPREAQTLAKRYRRLRHGGGRGNAFAFM